MKKELSVYVLSLLMLTGCSSVPLTGRKQLLLVSDQEVLSSSLTQYNDYIKSAQKSTNATQTAMVVRVGKNIAERALPMFDKLVIAVAVSKLKHASEEISKRVEDIRKVFPKECAELVDEADASKGYRLEVVSYDDLTIDLAHRMGARFLVRGVRSAKDFEYEREQADINKQLGGVETILLFSDPRYSSISSTLVRELRFFGREVDEFLPKIK